MMHHHLYQLSLIMHVYFLVQTQAFQVPLVILRNFIDEERKTRICCSATEAFRLLRCDPPIFWGKLR